MPILAIDLGTSNVKAAVVDRKGTLLGTGRGSIETLHTADGGAEQDPELVWEAVLNATDQALASLANRRDVRGVACASQYSSIVPVDAAGSPTGNMVVWMDKRGAPERLRQLPGGTQMKPSLLQMARWLQIHGIPPLASGSDSLAHMRWIKLARPEVYGRTATFLEPMDYVTARLSGRRVTNLCSSFMMLLTDNRRPNPAYHPTLLKWSGLDIEKLPELVPIDEPLGPILPAIAERLGLAPDTLVFPPLNDTQAGGIGASAFAGEHAGVSIGTTGVCITHVDFKKTDVLNSLASMPSPFPGRNFVMAEAGIGGGAVKYFLEHLVFARDRFGDHSLEERFSALERAIEPIEPGSDGVLFLPWLTGSITPAEDGKVRGGFLNISLRTTREHLAKAVLEGVAFNQRWVQERVERFAKRDISRIKFYGGGALSSAWSQIFADVLNCPVEQLRDPEFAVSRGVALLGFHRLGELALDEIEAGVPVAAVYQPRPEASVRYDAMFTQFVRVFKKNRDVFRALNVGS
ncbi:MAG TPA: FGGY-family carbohydrate kinase [Polyangiales bacterium]|nr:FGGY-family carbohydrate kinase [Polyangiales bacterium]